MKVFGDIITFEAIKTDGMGKTCFKNKNVYEKFYAVIKIYQF